MIKTIKAYECSDGEYFRSEEDAEKYQNKLNFLIWYENGNVRLYDINGEDMYEWLTTNTHVIYKLLDKLV